MGSVLQWLGCLLAALLPLQTVAATRLPTLPLSGAANEVHTWIVRTHDNRNLPFLIIDKRHAHLWVFDSRGALQGNAPVLLGSARGDHTAPGIGDLKLADIRHEDRTTPAGRFVAELGRNLRGEDVVWVDYESGVSIHPVLTSNPAERREQRLLTPTVEDNRVSFGCINVPKEFFAQTVLGTVRHGNDSRRSVVYILPESDSLDSAFALSKP
jgi:hypothetical protein